MISDIRLQQFRSYVDGAFEFGETVNIIVGPNGSGKTNLLEGLLVAARGSSYRVSDRDLLAFDAEWARIQVHDFGSMSDRVIKLELTGLALQKTFVINDKTYKRLPSDKYIPVVVFEPNHLQLLHGGPELRRSYLDDLLEQISPQFGLRRKQYKRVVSQRNSLLKRYKKPSNQELFPWDLRLSELGAVIARERAQLCSRINDQLPTIYATLSGSKKTPITVQYDSQFPIDSYETHFMHALTERLTTDIERGYTTRGPHREDMTVYYGDSPLELVASRGETRTTILALKIIELQELERSTDHRPLLLLDDVFSELDGARRQALTGYLDAYQTFITTTDADIVVNHFMDNCTIIPLT